MLVLLCKLVKRISADDDAHNRLRCGGDNTSRIQVHAIHIDPNGSYPRFYHFILFAPLPIFYISVMAVASSLLTELPQEILVNIFAVLERDYTQEDLRNLAYTCKRLHSVVCIYCIINGSL